MLILLADAVVHPEHLQQIISVTKNKIPRKIPKVIPLTRLSGLESLNLITLRSNVCGW